MKKNKYISNILFLLMVMAFTPYIYASSGAKITDIEHVETSNYHKVLIHLDKKLSADPTLEIRSNLIQLEIPNSYVWPRIEKNVNLDGKSNESKLTAYQFTREIVRFRVLPNFKVSEIGKDVSIVDKGRVLEVIFPRLPGKDTVANSNNPKDQRREVKSKSNVQEFDESYLDKLVQERGQDNPIKSDFDSAWFGEPQSEEEDEVNVIQSSVLETEGGSGLSDSTNSFSIAQYIGKFAAFLGIVLVLFYGVITVLKKGVLRKGRLSLFNDTKIVEVLNTTYIGPKRSLMLIKAHNQVILVGSSENGFEMLSEIRDVAGLFKSGEKEIAGSNFDTSLMGAKQSDKEFKLKPVEENLSKDLSSFLKNNEEQDVSSSITPKSKGEQLPVDKVRLSDQIKDKVKSLKSLQ